LLRQATAVVHDRLLASATPQMRVAIGGVLAKVSEEVGARARPRDYRSAQKACTRHQQCRRSLQIDAHRILPRE